MNELRWVKRRWEASPGEYEDVSGWSETILQYRTAEDYTDELGMTRSRAVWRDVPTVDEES
jgi:hypothetical protein